MMGKQLACFILIGLATVLSEDVGMEMPQSIQQPPSSVLLGKQYEPWLYSVAASILIGLSGIFPLLVVPIDAGPSLKHGRAARTLRFLLSFAVGGLLGDVFLHLLPEAWDHLEKGRSNGNNVNHMYLGMWVLAGIFTFIILEIIFTGEEKSDINETSQQRFKINLSTNFVKKSVLESKNGGRAEVHGHQYITSSSSTRNRGSVNMHHDTSHMSNGHANGHCNNMHDLQRTSECHDSKQITGYLNLLANSIDNFTHGLAVAGSFLVSRKVGVLTTFAILIHEIPHEIGDFAILLKSGFNRWEAAKAQIITATVGIIGAITALSVESTQTLGDKTIWILPFTAGGFLNIALVNVLPDLLKEKDLRESLKMLMCLLTGVTVMAGVTLLCE